MSVFQSLSITLDRRSGPPLPEQLRMSIETAIVAGQLPPGARLPSWQDLASQLGVSRGTVKTAYDRLTDAQLIVSAGPAGTFVSDHPPQRPKTTAGVPVSEDPFTLIGLTSPSNPPRLFQLGVPAHDALSTKTWSRILVQAARKAAVKSHTYPDPRGEPILRQQIAASLAISRSLSCREEQIFVTNGFAGALGLIVRALSLEGREGWIEDPGYPLSRAALELCNVRSIAIPVDEEGIDVAYGASIAGHSAFAVVTPGQQAPLGITMSLTRRRALLDWAGTAGAFIIEDDYLGELQLTGRAAPALASLDGAGRVIHIGTFSKTISPTLRLGFVVVPEHLVERFSSIVACLAPASAIATQLAIASFMADGHLMRHLRKLRRLYGERRDIVAAWLDSWPFERQRLQPRVGGLSLLAPLPDEVSDVEIVRRAGDFGLAPSPLSRWYGASGHRKSGLLLGVTNVTPRALEENGGALLKLIWAVA